MSQTIQQLKEEIMEEARNLPVCEGCRGEGNWLAECCDGSRNCPCQGRPYLPGKCHDCEGSGLQNIYVFLSTALDKVIKATADAMVGEERKHVNDGINLSHGKDELWSCLNCYDDKEYNTRIQEEKALRDEITQ